MFLGTCAEKAADTSPPALPHLLPGGRRVHVETETAEVLRQWYPALASSTSLTEEVGGCAKFSGSTSHVLNQRLRFLHFSVHHPGFQTITLENRDPRAQHTWTIGAIKAPRSEEVIMDCTGLGACREGSLGLERCQRSWELRGPKGSGKGVACLAASGSCLHWQEPSSFSRLILNSLTLLAFPGVVWYQGLAIPRTQPRAICLVGTSTRGPEFVVLRAPQPTALSLSLLLPCVPSTVPILGATTKGHKSHGFCPQRAHQVSPCVVNHVADCAEFFVEPRTESCKCQKRVVGQVCSDPEGRLANRAARELPKGRRPRTYLEKGDTEGTKSCPSVSNSFCLSTSLYLFFFPGTDPSLNEQALFMTGCGPVIKTLLGQLTGAWVKHLW